MPHPNHDKNQTTAKHSSATNKDDLIEAARELSQHTDASRKKQDARIQLLILATGLLGVMCFFSGRECLYSVLGTTIDAKVTRQFNEQRSAGRHGGTYSVVVVDYSFTDASGRQRQERDEIRFGSGPSVSETVPVEYISGIAGFSRVRGKPSRVIFVLIACVVPLLIVLGVWMQSVRPRSGAIMIWGGVFLMAAIDAVAMSILPFGDSSLQRDWIGILSILVSLVFAAMGYIGMWFSGRGLWKAMTKGHANGN